VFFRQNNYSFTFQIADSLILHKSLWLFIILYFWSFNFVCPAILSNFKISNASNLNENVIVNKYPTPDKYHKSQTALIRKFAKEIKNN